MSNTIDRFTAALGKICGGTRAKRAASKDTANAAVSNIRETIGSLLTKVKACFTSSGIAEKTPLAAQDSLKSAPKGMPYVVPNFVSLPRPDNGYHELINDKAAATLESATAPKVVAQAAPESTPKPAGKKQVSWAPENQVHTYDSDPEVPKDPAEPDAADPFNPNISCPGPRRF